MAILAQSWVHVRCERWHERAARWAPLGHACARLQILQGPKGSAKGQSNANGKVVREYTVRALAAAVQLTAKATILLGHYGQSPHGP